MVEITPGRDTATRWFRVAGRDIARLYGLYLSPPSTSALTAWTMKATPERSSLSSPPIVGNEINLDHYHIQRLYDNDLSCGNDINLDHYHIQRLYDNDLRSRWPLPRRRVIHTQGTTTGLGSVAFGDSPSMEGSE